MYGVRCMVSAGRWSISFLNVYIVRYQMVRWIVYRPYIATRVYRYTPTCLDTQHRLIEELPSNGLRSTATRGRVATGDDPHGPLLTRGKREEGREKRKDREKGERRVERGAKRVGTYRDPYAMNAFAITKNKYATLLP